MNISPNSNIPDFSISTVESARKIGDLTYEARGANEQKFFIIWDKGHNPLSLIQCKVFGSSFIDKIKEGFLRLFNWKWIKVENLLDKKIFVNKKSLEKALDINDDRLKHYIKTNSLAQKIHEHAQELENRKIK